MAYNQMVVFLAVLVVVVSSRSPQKPQKDDRPWFCEDYDCPAFTAQDMGAYDVRTYNETKWATVTRRSRKSCTSGSINHEMFSALYDYITGENEDEQYIAMTVPVLTKVEKLGRKSYEVTMMFYLTSANPPAPTNTDVVIMTRPAGNVLVRSFPSMWWPTPGKYSRELRELKRAISDGVDHEKDVYYKVGYSAPYRYFKKKQHEIWIDSQ